MRIPMRMLACLPAMLVAVACHLEEPFVRDNHWDLDSKATKTLTGPDSTFSIGDRFTLTLVADPPLPPGPLTVTWTSGGLADTAVQIFPAGYGEFVVRLANAEFRPMPVGVRFDDELVVWTVVVGQKLVGFDLFCGSAGAPVACDLAPIAVGQSLTVNSTMADANTNALRRRDALMMRAATVVRDPSVLTAAPTIANPAGAWTVRGVAPGSTWLVVTADGVRDSVRVVVGP